MRRVLLLMVLVLPITGSVIVQGSTRDFTKPANHSKAEVAKLVRAEQTTLQVTEAKCFPSAGPGGDGRGASEARYRSYLRFIEDR